MGTRSSLSIVDSVLDSRSVLNSRRHVESARGVAFRLVDSVPDSRSELNSMRHVEMARGVASRLADSTRGVNSTQGEMKSGHEE